MKAKNVTGNSAMSSESSVNTDDRHIKNPRTVTERKR